MTFCFRVNHSFFKAVSTTIILVLLALCFPAQAEVEVWSERKFDKTILKIDKDIRRKRWAAAIERSQEALPNCIVLYTERSPSCILILKNINQSYEKLRTFNPNKTQIESAYRLSSEILGPAHPTTRSARDYYYKNLIFNEKYAEAIPLLMEIIHLEKNGANDAFQLMGRYNQLYALEGLTENWPAEEAALIMVLRLAQQVLGKDSEEFKAAVEALAHSYCAQKKYYEYFELIKEQQQEISCFSAPR
jgi:hypothetical protein